jgi:hypothetical protein
MNSKFYISYDAARLLKEKGYDEKCTFAYTDTSNGSDINGRIVFNSNDYPVGIYPCPTKAEAIDWLESKGIIVELSYDDRPHKDFLHWEYFVYVNDKDGWLEAVVCSWEENNYYKTRLEAEEAAIIKALELL